MNILHKIFSLTLCFLALMPAAKAADVVWFDGHHHVSYVTQHTYSPVVETALALFAEDMKAVTGHRAEKSHKGKIEIIQLNTLTNKEFKKIQKRRLPYEKVITKPDAFYIGVHDGRLLVIGDNARGTAYGIMELSRMAGVSPWVWWGDVVPEQRRQLKTDANLTMLQIPSVEFRGISLSDEKWLQNAQTNRKFLELMLRLRANTVCGKNAGKYRKQAESFDFSVISDPSEPALTWKDDSQWFSATQPGLIFYRARNAYQENIRKTWVASVRNPKIAAYQLSLFLDMAWDEKAVTAKNLEQHLEKWLGQQFGKTNGHRLLPVMRKFYELTNVCKPENMDQCQFNAQAFGNELERYLGEYAILRQITESMEKDIRPELHDAYFAAIKYPVHAAAAVATKQLEAQEARHLARKESFHRDSEALTSAARSVKAWRELRQLTQDYSARTAKGKWDGIFPRTLFEQPVFAAPTLPDQLSEDEINRYGKNEEYRAQINTNDCIARNAADYTTATGNVETIPLLGNSACAVVLGKDGQLNYRFNAAKAGKAVLRIALVTECSAIGDAAPLFSINIDGNEKTYSRQELSISIPAGIHTLSIKALKNHLVIDQWMIDFNPQRPFFRYPI